MEPLTVSTESCIDVPSCIGVEHDDARLHPLLKHRWSPTSWAVDQTVEPSLIDTLLEAARRAPSAGNSQPWAFIVGRLGDAVHERMVKHLALSSARWAPRAALLVANLCHARVDGTDWAFSEFAEYDVGQAVASMTFQAEHLGLKVRQFRAFDREGLAAEFDIPDHWTVFTLAAIGRPPHLDRTGDSLGTSGLRKPAGELLWPSAFIAVDEA